MTKQELFNKLETAYEEMVELIRANSERNQFNSAYFKKPFMEWYTKQIDKWEKLK